MPKVQSNHPTKYHHSMYFPDEDLRMPPSLHGVFSFFSSKKPLASSLNEHDKKYISDNYERSMLGYEGNIKWKEDRKSYVVNAVVAPEKMECTAFVG